MPEQTLQEISQETQQSQEPNVQPKVEQGEPTQQNSSDDLLSRVTQYQVENKPETTQIDNKEEGSFDLKEIESITDPIAKEQALNAYKSFQRGFNKKYQELAELRKALESSISDKDAGKEEWTRDRIQSLLKDESFVKAAQEFQGTQAEDDYSSLSDAERQKIAKMEEELNNLKNINEKSLLQQKNLERQRYHEQFSQKYANYDSDEIDQLSIEIASGKLNATPEHIYKAFKHDDNVRRAYEMGRKDEREGITEKAGVLSIEGQNTYKSDEPIVRKDGESSESVWARASANALAKLTGNSSIKK